MLKTNLTDEVVKVRFFLILDVNYELKGVHTRFHGVYSCDFISIVNVTCE